MSQLCRSPVPGGMERWISTLGMLTAMDGASGAGAEGKRQRMDRPHSADA
jgi:hypothetical protein